jgi:hypothetical protein
MDTGAATMDGMSTLGSQFEARRIDPRIGAVIAEFARTHTVVPCITDVDNFRLSVAADAYAAVYPSPAWMDVALPPGEARAMARRHGLDVTKTNDTTAYLRVPASYLETDSGRAVALELLESAWDKAFRGPRWEMGLGEQPGSHGEMCDRHFIEKSITGACPECDE